MGCFRGLIDVYLHALFVGVHGNDVDVDDIKCMSSIKYPWLRMEEGGLEQCDVEMT